MTSNFSGHAWEGKVSASAYYNSGKRLYNLMDKTGDHAYPSNHFNELDEETKAIVFRCLALAEEESVKNYKYAKERERDTIFEHLKYCFLVTVGYGGVTWHIDEKEDTTSKIEGYHIDDDEMAEINRLNIPFVDITSIPLNNCITPSISGPLPPTKANRYDAQPWHSLSNVPLDVYCAWWEHFGAIVKNIKPADLQPQMFCGRQADMIFHF
jgi:hypothetical protein